MTRDFVKQKVDCIINAVSEARKQQGMSHEKLAEMIGLHRPIISLKESKKRIPTILTLLLICKAL